MFIMFLSLRFVKMSSPNLNNVLLSGNLLIYTWVIISGIDTTVVAKSVFAIVCQVLTLMNWSRFICSSYILFNRNKMATFTFSLEYSIALV